MWKESAYGPCFNLKSAFDAGKNPSASIGIIFADFFYRVWWWHTTKPILMRIPVVCHGMEVSQPLARDPFTVGRHSLLRIYLMKKTFTVTRGENVSI